MNYIYKKLKSHKFFIGFIHKVECFPRVVWHAFDKMFIFICTLQVGPEKDGGVAVVRIGGMGDMILSIPLLLEMKKKHYVTLICSSDHMYMKEIFYDCVNSFIFFDEYKFRKNILYRFSFLKRISSMKFSCTIHSGISRQQGGADVIAWAAKSKKTIAFDAREWHSCEKLISDRWFDTLIDGKYGKIHELERMSILAGTALNYDEFLKNCDYKVVEKKYVYNNYAIFNVGSSTSVREWEISNFVEVARALHEKKSLLPIFIGTEKDKLKISGMKIPFPHENLIGKLTVKEYILLLKNADIIICNESSPMHIGVMFDRPTVAIVSGGEFNNYCKYPDGVAEKLLVISSQDNSCFNCGWNCIYKKNDGHSFPCLDAVRSHDVIENILSWEFFI
ncbi:glycosyltransferase family 9 protein [Acidithiobacillus concretivorus]|uniref:Glycosyltransferase family 9 protein n=1 Tax=Acidithiobacillus concretivorus TaxID=3063952 RepID=A0ABS5ZL59_9PROT|nr:glycosyltransferase family 9 protein [Acidithiobacillus concretivorus]MBU2737389.1 glycosyltransferase family 9 protein [Acidithiobacillus concretivorus]